MLSQPFGLIDEQLSRRQGHWSVGAIGRQLLESAAERGAGPKDVAPGAPFARVVEAVARRMPSDRRHAAWTRLGSKAAELIRWWQTQRDLEKFFREFDADPARENFWRRYMRTITGVEAHKRASALAMKIGPVWFVEFGKPGNACYAYGDAEWRGSVAARRRARSERDLKWLHPRKWKKSHIPDWDWEPRFVDWVYDLTRIRP